MSNIKDIYGLTPAQEGMYYQYRIDPSSKIYHICLVFGIGKGTDLEKISQSFELLLQRHEVLNNAFAVSKSTGAVKQVVLNNRKPDFRVQNTNSEFSSAELEKITADIEDEPFDLQKSSLFRMRIIDFVDKRFMVIHAHHIVLDGWSIPVLMRDMDRFYRSLTQGTSFSELLQTIQEEVKKSASFSSYVAEISKQDKEISLDYWKNLLEDYEPAYFFNNNTHRQETVSQRKSVDITVKDIIPSIEQYAKEHKFSLNTVFESALGLLLQRYSGTDDVIFCKPISGRNVPLKEIENAVGPFINTVIARVGSKPEQTVEDIMSTVQNQSVLTNNFGFLPLSDLFNKCKINSDSVDVLFAFENYNIYGSKEILSTALELRQISFHEQTEFPIALSVYQTESDFRIKAVYETECFSEKQITDFLESYIYILQQITDGKVNDLYSIKTLNNKQFYTISEFNDTTVDYPKDKSVQELFEEQAEEAPDKRALVACDKTLTYKELNVESNKIAHSLIEKGIGAGDIVAFVLPRKSCLIGAMFGILKTGAAYLPIDPDWPQDRIEYILKDSKAKLLITEESIEELLNSGNSSNPDTEISAEDICYCIYTSGSTGSPKGVLIKHKNVLNYVANNKNNVLGGIIKEDCRNIVSVTTASFDIFVTESILPLVNGMTVILADEKQSNTQKELSGLLKKTPADVLQTTPSKMKMLISNRAFTEYLKGMKAIIIGGEAMDKTLAKELKELTDAEIFNIYGPTETTVWSSYAKIENGDVTIGKPIANTQIYIVDKYMQPVPIGVTGELCIAGDGVCAGYLNRPELTAEKFVDNPFGEGKLYKTGDLAYWREDGNIVYVGRNDFQVKVRGLRIELGEIENAITAIDGIENAVVTVCHDKTDRQLICAFYTGEEKDAKEIRHAIGKNLPKYMLPHIFTHMYEMPLTSSGKINRNALPEVNFENIETNAEYIEPQTEKEKLLVSAIEDILNVEKIGVNDNFFDLGGDSLKAIELIAELENAGFSVEAKTIFESETIQELAEELGAYENTEEEITYGSVLPATPAQMRVYTAQIMDGDSTLYNIPYVFKVKDIDADRLEKAINQLIERHESLRTHFENRNGEIVQVIEKEASVKVQKLESDDISQFIRPFDLTKSPLMRVGYIENTVMIDLHHIIADGESLPVFYRELNELYMGRELANSAVQYGEFAVRTGYTDDNEQYWMKVFEDEVTVPELPTDFPRGENQSFTGSAVYDFIDIQLHNKILAKCKELNITPYAFYMGCFNIFVSKFSGSEDIVVGMPVIGRDSKYLNTIGMFVNTVALSNKPDGTKTVSDFLAEVKEKSISAMANQNYPLGELAKKLQIQSQGRNLLFDVMLAYQSEQMTDIVFGDEKAELMPVSVTTSKCDFTFHVMPRETDVVIMAEYCTDLYKQATIQKFIDSFKLILGQALAENTQIKDISPVSEAEMSVLKGETVELDTGATLYSIFEKYATARGDKICILDDKNITFKEFVRLVEALDYTIREGLGDKKQVIGVYTDRSLEMYLSVYAIIRGGNAYMPIDVAQPLERTEYMISNSNVSLVLGQGKYRERISNAEFLDVTDFLNQEHGNSPVLPVGAEADDTAYVIYTSGTTGAPKGAMISHRSIVNRINWMHRMYPVNDESVILQKTPYTFDVSVWELFWWGLFGGKLAYSKPDEHFLPAKIIDEIVKNKVTHLHFVPSVFSVFLDFIEKNGIDTDILNSIRYIFLSGEALSSALVQRFNKIFGDSHIGLHNLYGPTECAVDVTYYDCKAQEESLIPIGKPIDNTSIYIMDKCMTPVPVGVKGEIYIGGVNVGKGYINNPQLTAEKFVDNPFDKGKLYKTGDIGYIDKNGEIIFCGRKDTQIKINGQRIEIDEIEYVISSLNGIASTVILLKKINNSAYLVAFYSGKKYSSKELEDRCLQKLPRYMVPSVFVHVDEIPVNRNGKADKKALNLIEVKTDIEGSETQPPLNKTEEMICKAFEEILKRDDIGRNTDFISSGGSSLDIIQFVSDERFKNITVKDFILDPTPAGIAKRLLEVENKDNFKYLSALKIAEGSGKSVVIFPFAGGTAASFALFAERINNLVGASVYFVDFVHSEKECIEISKEIEELSKVSDVVLYGHCVGAKLAIDIASFAEDSGVKLKGIVSAAYVPQVRRNIATWKYVPYRVVKKILSNAKADFSSLSEDSVKKLIKRFKLDTQFVSESFDTNPRKINTPIKVLLASGDPFTKKYKNPEKNYHTLSEKLLSVETFESDNHYFQDAKIKLISETVKFFLEC